ncbi:unnamed protein product [Hymenolepis diminuta]|uniref:Uncharacterized protein n=1 Tax=Hymenolepis diminuta TaxID=6216 RepID=A0A564Z092_HYMDI|nr:unnamed protein product [Hymenolepis diminuta]
MFKLLLLFGLVYATFAAHIDHHRKDHDFHDGDHDDDDDGDDDDDDLDESELIPARSNYGTRRTVMWTGPNSYKGYRDYRKTPPQAQQRPTYRSTPTYYSRPSQYNSRDTQYPSSRQSSRTVKVPLYNKKRAGDQKYKQGLLEFADLMA